MSSLASHNPLVRAMHGAVLACVVLLLWPALGWAQQPEATSAAEDYARGAQLYNEGRNREALEAFNSAIQKSDEPVYVCNRAVVLITLEEYDRAIDDLTVCRDTYEMPEASRAQIDAQLKALERFESVLRPRAREVARLIANPPEKEDPVTTPDPVTRPVQPVATSPLRAVGWVSLGLGAGALVGMGAVEAVNRQEVNDYKTQCSGSEGLSGDTLTTCTSSQDMLMKQQRLARALLVSGSALGVTGLVLLLTTRRAPTPAEDARAWQLSPALGPDGAQVTWTLSF